MELEIENENKFWRDQRNVNVFNLFVDGKDIPTIAETLSMKPVTVERMITEKYFIKKLESHIRGVLFTNQVAKIIASTEIFSKLWDRVTNNIEEIPPEICLKELTKLFPNASKKEGFIINPKNMNIFINAMKGNLDPTDIGKHLEKSDLDGDMGYEGLSDDDESIYPELESSSEELGKEKK